MKRIVISFMLCMVPVAGWCASEVVKTVDESGRVTYRNRVQDATGSSGASSPGVYKVVDDSGHVTYQNISASTPQISRNDAASGNAGEIVRKRLPDGRVEFSNVIPAVAPAGNATGVAAPEAAGADVETAVPTVAPDRRLTHISSRAADTFPDAFPAMSTSSSGVSEEVAESHYGSWPKVATLAGILAAGLLLAWLFIRWVTRPIARKPEVQDPVRLDRHLYRDMQM